MGRAGRMAFAHQPRAAGYEGWWRMRGGVCLHDLGSACEPLAVVPPPRCASKGRLAAGVVELPVRGRVLVASIYLQHSVPLNDPGPRDPALTGRAQPEPRYSDDCRRGLQFPTCVFEGGPVCRAHRGFNHCPCPGHVQEPRGKGHVCLFHRAEAISWAALRGVGRP